MKSAIFLFFLLCSAAYAQTITSVTVESNGWAADVTISNFTDLGTVATGLAAQTNNPTSAKMVLTVTRPTDYAGSAGTVVDTVYGMAPVGYAYPLVWAAAHGYALNQTIVDGTTNCNASASPCIEKVIACSGSCTSAGAHPTWPTTIGNTVVDNSGANQVTWKMMGGVFVQNAPPTLAPNDINIATAGQATIRVALSDFVYSGDTVSVAIAANFYHDNGPGGGGSYSSALSSTSATNSSTLAYSTTASVCRWSWPGFERVTGNFPIEIFCANRFARNLSEVESVVFTATDQHSHSVSYTVAAMTNSVYNRNWANSSVPYASGPGDLSGGTTLVYATTINVSTLTQGDQISVNAVVYPWAGDSTAVYSSSAGTSPPSLTMGPLLYILDKTGAYGVSFAHVKTGGAASCGSHVYNTRAGAEGDSTGLASIALAASCLEAYNNTNYSRADAGGGMILVDSGNWSANAASTYALGTMKTWMVVDKVSTLSTSQVSITSQGGNNAPDSDSNTLIKFQNITINGNFLFFGGSGSGTDSVWLHDCVETGGFNPGNNSGASISNLGGVAYFTQNWASSGSGSAYYKGSAQNAPFALVRGNYLSSSPTVAYVSPYADIANYGGEWIETIPGNAASQIVSDNAVIAYNVVLNDTDALPTIGTYGLTIGAAVVQDILEGPAQFGDPLTSQTSNVNVNNLIIHHLTQGSGGQTYFSAREHVAYNVTGTYVNTMNNWSTKWSDWNLMAIEQDSSNLNTGPNPARVGAWPVAYNVGSIGNLNLNTTQFTDFAPTFMGLGQASSYFPNPYYTNGSVYFGNYNILSNSQLLGAATWTTTANEVLPYDLAGAARTCSGGCTVGAYLYNYGGATLTAGSKMRGGVVGTQNPVGGTVATPTFSPTSPYTGTATTVTISDTTPGAALYYCQDVGNTCSPTTLGSSASASSTGYVRAQGTKIDWTNSAIASWQGTISVTPTIVQGGLVGHTTGSTTVTTKTINANVASGDQLIAYAYCATSGRTLTVADSISTGGSQTWVNVTPLQNNTTGSVGVVSMWMVNSATACTAACSDTITVTASSSCTGDFYAGVGEFTGIPGSGWDQGPGITSGLTSSSVTPSQTPELLFGLLYGGNGNAVPSAGGSYTNLGASDAGGHVFGMEGYVFTATPSGQTASFGCTACGTTYAGIVTFE